MERVLSLSMIVREKSYRTEVHPSIPQVPGDVALIDLCAYCDRSGARHSIAIRKGVAVLDYMDTGGARRQLVSSPLKPGPNVITFAFVKAPKDQASPAYGMPSTPSVGRFYVHDAWWASFIRFGAFAFSTAKNGTGEAQPTVEKVVLTVEDRD